ncbi:MAG TPA: IPT/TIG domain-containing protein, partial [Terriglobia bacterium]|nr:IPT/TIG domain-containing protein [Terriglobia bacterium]
EAGLTPMQALQSATLWSAEMLAGKNGARGRPPVGVIAPGAFADLVVLSADPLAEISNTRRIERVMKGGRFLELGYQPAYYSFTRPPRSIAMATPQPEISAISPHTVLEGSPAFELVIHGVGFVGNSVVRVDQVAVPTTFLNPRMIQATIPAALVRSATPNPFDAPGPEQHSGVFGDRTIAISVFNPPPEGGVSNRVALRVRAKWMGLEDRIP